MNANADCSSLDGGFFLSSQRVPSTIDFAAIGDHVRLPSRFFARLHAAANSLLVAA